MSIKTTLLVIFSLALFFGGAITAIIGLAYGNFWLSLAGLGAFLSTWIIARFIKEPRGYIYDPPSSPSNSGTTQSSNDGVCGLCGAPNDGGFCYSCGQEKR